MQMLQLEERAAMQAARDRAEVTHGELSVRLEAAETAALESAKSVTSIEEDRKWLSERYTLTTGQLKQVQSELNQLYEELSALNARHQALQLERASNAASAQLLEERLREVQSQRDAAESERMNLQRELCTANSRLQDADERARSAEAALSVAQSEVAVGKSELRERKASSPSFLLRAAGLVRSSDFVWLLACTSRDCPVAGGWSWPTRTAASGGAPRGEGVVAWPRLA
jgi:chromosome segregation ATPase